MKMRIFFMYVFISSIAISCNNEKKQTTTEGKTTNDTLVTTEKVQPGQSAENKILPVVDTGQTWFGVYITRNDSAFMDYEGSWPVFLHSNNSATLQLSKSRQIMSVTDILTVYMNGMPSGKTPVVLSNREKGTASMIFSPVTDGAYGLPISPTEGYLNITKNVDSVISGDFEAKGTDLNKDIYVIKGYFLNAKINPDKIQ